jgi:molybdate transport system substrate-binding protein
MKRHLVILAIGAALSAACARAAELRVSAAASLSEAMTEISALHEKAHGEKILLNCGGSNALARQIKAGAPCDLFFSADEATLKQLLAEDLLHANSVANLLGNSLVVITPAKSPLQINAAADLISPSVKRLALGDPAAVPAGVYARKWLESQAAWKSIEPRMVATENVRGALAAVASGNVDAGIVYKTDAMTSKEVGVAYQVPTGQTPPIIYPIAATKSSPDPGKAIRFIAFLRTQEAAAIFRKHGFVLLPSPTEP